MKRRPHAMLLIWLTLVAFAHSQEPSREDRIAAYMKRCDEMRAVAIKNWPDRIKEESARLAMLKRARVDKTRKSIGGGDQYIFPSKESKDSYVATSQKQLDAYKTKLAAAKNKAEPYYAAMGPDTRQLVVGDIGLVPTPDVWVISIIDKQTLVARMRYTYRSAGVDNLKTFYQTVIVKGLPTDNLADDQETVLNGPWEATGTDSFITAAGAKSTVVVLERFAPPPKNK